MGNAITYVKTSDWCHLCGAREQVLFAQFDLDKNAEHGEIQPTRFVRLCEPCITKMAVHMVDQTVGETL